MRHGHVNHVRSCELLEKGQLCSREVWNAPVVAKEIDLSKGRAVRTQQTGDFHWWVLEPLLAWQTALEGLVPLVACAANLIQFAQFVLTASCDSLAWKSTAKLLSYLCHLDFPVLVTWSSANNKTKKWGSDVQLAEVIWPRYVKNAWPALFVSTATAALVALLFAFELLPGWVKTSNYAPPEPHVPQLSYFFFNMKGFIHALSWMLLSVWFCMAGVRIA